jgi:hypothetical protein
LHKLGDIEGTLRAHTSSCGVNRRRVLRMNPSRFGIRPGYPIGSNCARLRCPGRIDATGKSARRGATLHAGLFVQSESSSD